jgi:hypothetical protein
LLSLSWSPSLLCGIPAGLDSDDGAAGGAWAADFEPPDGGDDDVGELELPQPAAKSAATVTARVASRRIGACLVLVFTEVPLMS